MGLLPFELDEQIIRVLNNNSMTRAELCRRMNVPRTTMFDHLKRLELGGLVCFNHKKRYENGKPLRGRPNTIWSVIKRD